MLRKTGIGLTAMLAVVLTALVAAVSNAHFVGNPTLSSSGNTATASGKVAGLGNVEVITVRSQRRRGLYQPGQQAPEGSQQGELLVFRGCPGAKREGELQRGSGGHLPAGLHPADDRSVVQPERDRDGCRRDVPAVPVIC